MGAIIHDDIIYGGGGGSEAIELTQAQYNALSYAEKHDPDKVYYITDGQGGGGYTLPIADATTLGGIKVGSGLSIDNSGILSANGAVIDDTITSSSAVWSSQKVTNEITNANPNFLEPLLCSIGSDSPHTLEGTGLPSTLRPSSYYIAYSISSHYYAELQKRSSVICTLDIHTDDGQDDRKFLIASVPMATMNLFSDMSGYALRTRHGYYIPCVKQGADLCGYVHFKFINWTNKEPDDSRSFGFTAAFQKATNTPDIYTANDTYIWRVYVV